MTDTRNFVTCFEKPIETKPSTDTDEVLESYLKILNDIMDEEEYNTIVETNYKGANYGRTN